VTANGSAGAAPPAAVGDDLRAALRALPKVELHCHLEGCMRPGTVAELARAGGVPLPLGPGEDVTALYRYGSLEEFLAVFWLVQSVLRSRADWARLAYEAALDGAAAGRVYAEVFVTPARHLAAGQRLADVLAGVEDGLAAGDEETGSRTRVVLDMDRAFGPQAGLQLVTELGSLRRERARGADGVLGIGMDSTELGVDPASFLPAYALARRLGLRRTGHQGEDTPAAAVATVVDVLGAERVDHGLSVTQDPALVARLAAERVPLTVCPTSNVVIANRVSSLAEHPFPALRAAGLLVTVNTDDPALTDLSLDGEYAACAAAWGWDLAEATDVALAGVEASWLDDGDKRALGARVRAATAPPPRAAAGGRSGRGGSAQTGGVDADDAERAGGAG